MQPDEVRRIVRVQFHQSLANRGTEITSIPKDELDAIVDAQTDAFFAVWDAMAEEDYSMAPAHSPSVSTDGDGNEPEEELIWRGRPYLTVGIHYELTTQRLRTIRGLLGRDIQEIELVRIRDTKAKQHTGERLFNIGDITIISNDPSTPEYVLNNISEPFAVREKIRKAMMDEKKRRGLSYREEM